MYYTLSDIAIGAKAIHFAMAGEFLFVIDEDFKLHLIHTNRNFTLSGSLSIKEAFRNDFDAMHFDPSCLAVSSHKHIALTSLLKNQTVIFSFEGMLEQTHTLSWHRYSITAVAYSAKGEFLASADCHGTLFIFDARQYTIVASPPVVQGAIQAITFSKHADFVIYGTKEGRVYVFDLFSHTLLDEAALGSAIVHLQSMEDDQILILDGAGHLTRYSLPHKKIHPIAKSALEVTHIRLLSKNRAVLLYDKSGSFEVMNLEGGEDALSLKTDLKDIHSMWVQERFLILALPNKRIRVLDMEKYQNEVNMNFDVKNFQKIREQFSKNHFLCLSKEVQAKTTHGWNEVLREVIQNIIEGNLIRAHKLAAPFFEDIEKQETYKELCNHTEELTKFHRLIRDKQIAEAYKMLQSHPLLKKSKKYEDLERGWTNAYNAAKKLMLKAPQQNRSICERLLLPYKWDESKNEMIDTLLNHIEVIQRADTAVKHQNFQLYFRLCEKHPFLQQALLYQKMIHFGRKKVQTIKKMIEKENLTQAREETSELEGYLPFAEEIISLETRITRTENLLEAKNEMDQERMFELVIQESALRQAAAFQTQFERFNNTLEIAFTHAHRGEARSCMEAMCNHMQIAALTHKVASLLKIAYVNQMIFCKIKKLEIDWDATLRQYMERFGSEPVLKRFLHHFKMREDITPLMDSANTLGYLELPYPDTIIISKHEEMY